MNQSADVTTGISKPIYIKCFFFNEKDDKVIYVYRIVPIDNVRYPFQLFKQSTDKPFGWENLSIYASVSDAVRVLLKELVPVELADEIYHGQASVSPQPIIDRLNLGRRSVSVFKSTDNELFRAGRDVAFDQMILRQN